MIVLFVPLRDDIISDCSCRNNLTKKRPFPFIAPNIDIVALLQLKVNLAYVLS